MVEAEWEYAARGPEGNIYPWRDDKPVCDKANHWGKEGDRVGETTVVGSKPDDANWVGALDMAGNVLELVNDWYQDDYYAVSQDSNPPGPETGAFRVQRGGSWFTGRDWVRSAFRTRY